MELTCIIIEDEPPALRKLEGFISKLSHIRLLSSFDNAIDALNYLRSNTVDLVFLDIQMEEFTGIQFLETLAAPPRIIITSAYETYAIKGYEYNVTDYLLKPYAFERFVQAVEKVVKTFHDTQPAPANDFIFVKTENRLEKINFSEILYIEGKGEYLRIMTPQKKIMTLQNFKSLEDILPASFVRVHKSFIVSIDKIEAIERNKIKINDIFIPISDTYRNIFLNKIDILKK